MKYQSQLQQGELEVEFHTVNPLAPTIIFLHDSLGCIKLWKDFPRQLASKANCNYLVYDRLGYGASSRNENLPNRPNNYHEIEADILLQLIKDFQITKPILFGHSHGATIAIIAASKEQYLIKAVIAEVAHVFVEDITLKGIETATNGFVTTNLRDRLIKYHGEKVDVVFWAWANVWLRNSFKNWNIEPLLSSIFCPVLIIQGEKDEYGTHEQVLSIYSEIKGIALKCFVPEVGHTPHKESPDFTLGISSGFIKPMAIQ